MSDRMLRPEEHLLEGLFYKFWMPNVRVPSGQAFAAALEDKGLELVGQAVALNANAIVLVCRMGQEQTYRQAATHVAFEVGAATGRGVLTDAVVVYQADGPPGLLEQATEPLRQAAARVEGAVAGVGAEARATTSTVRGAVDNFTDTVANLSTAAKWIAIGIPVVAAVGAGIYLVATWKRGGK